jgi:Na+/H+ antiporter NhaB
MELYLVKQSYNFIFTHNSLVISQTVSESSLDHITHKTAVTSNILSIVTTVVHILGVKKTFYGIRPSLTDS